MKKHSGMRPLDIVILLQISLFNDDNWFLKDIANKLKISASEVSESLNRSAIAGLLSADKKTLMKDALFEFLEFGMKYVFPQKPGALVRGISTAHSASPLKELLHSDEIYVWSFAAGNVRGQAIEPLYKTVPEVSKNNDKIYELLALSDALRIGRIREQKLAIEELRKRIYGSKK
jgi:hypothetical protein